MQTQLIPTENLLPPSIEMRQNMTMEGLDELAASISKHGVMQPLVVRPEGERFRIVAGHRRYEAVRRLQIREVPCNIVTVDARTEEELKIHENLKREDVDPVEEADYYMRLYKEQGFSVDDLVRVTGRSLNYIEGRLEMAGWPERVKAAVQGKAIAVAVARELVKFKDDVARDRFLDSAAQFGAPSNVVRDWRVRYEAEQAQQEARDAGGPLPPAAVTVEAPPIICSLGGHDMAGMIVQYVPICQQCAYQLEMIKAETIARRQAALRASGDQPS